jgi:hypothetical protein
LFSWFFIHWKIFGLSDVFCVICAWNSLDAPATPTAKMFAKNLLITQQPEQKQQKTNARRFDKLSRAPAHIFLHISATPTIKKGIEN